MTLEAKSGKEKELAEFLKHSAQVAKAVLNASTTASPGRRCLDVAMVM